MGEVQDRIIRDSEEKKVFTGEDFPKYYKNTEEAKRSFENLIARGYFDKGKVRETGQIIYISRSFKKQTNLNDIKEPYKIHENFFQCPKAKEFKGFDPLTTTETCETTCMGEGCMFLKECPAYQNKKKEEPSLKYIYKNN